MSVAIKVLEEALRVETVAADDFSKTVNHILNCPLVILLWLLAHVVCCSSDVVEVLFNILLQSLDGEDFVDAINEVLPAHMFSLLGRFEDITQQFELRL